MARQLRVFVLVAIVIATGLSLTLLPTRPASASVTGTITLSGNSDVQTTNLPFTFSSNSVYSVACGLQLSGGDLQQHVWWRVRVETPGLTPDYVISADEQWDWVSTAYVWSSVTPTFTSQVGSAKLQIDNADPVAQTFNYICNSVFLTSASYSSIASTSSSTTVPGQTSAYLYTSSVLPTNALVTAQVGFTVDPDTTATEIHTHIRVLISKQPSWYIAGADRPQQFWEISPSARRLTVDLNVMGLNGYQVIVWVYNADSVAHVFRWSVDGIWQSATKTISTVGSYSGTITIAANYGVLIATISTPDNSKVYLVVPGVSLNGYGDEAQYAQWGAYDFSYSDGTHAAGSESVFHWWLTSAVNFRSYAWRDTNTQVELVINNDDSMQQSFYYNFAVYQFTA